MSGRPSRERPARWRFRVSGERRRRERTGPPRRPPSRRRRDAGTADAKPAIISTPCCATARRGRCVAHPGRSTNGQATAKAAKSREALDERLDLPRNRRSGGCVCDSSGVGRRFKARAVRAGSRLPGGGARGTGWRAGGRSPLRAAAPGEVAYHRESGRCATYDHARPVRAGALSRREARRAARAFLATTHPLSGSTARPASCAPSARGSRPTAAFIRFQQVHRASR
jgi:hypothetical protein